MIKNIVFDMGNVLLNYSAMLVCESYIEDEADRKAVCTSIFISPEWLMLDMGVITEELALQKMKARLPERLHEVTERCFRDWHLFNMIPIKGIEEILIELKEKGYGLYICSNASLRLTTCYKDVIPCHELFDGILFSAEVKCMKPQKEMYEHLFERFQLNPEECFFIDDVDINIAGAATCGMDGYCHADGDLRKLREVLNRIL